MMAQLQLDAAPSPDTMSEYFSESLNSSNCSVALPKALKDALKRLATADAISSLNNSILDLLQNSVQDEGEVPELDLESHLYNPDWSEGVEDLNKLTMEQLWGSLGLQESLPYFNLTMDPAGFFTPATAEGRGFFADARQVKATLSPRWHQLIGIFRMVQRAFLGKPVLLMDEVGLGKTLQVIGVFAILAFFRHAYAVNGTFPGIFGEQLASN